MTNNATNQKSNIKAIGIGVILFMITAIVAAAIINTVSTDDNINGNNEENKVFVEESPNQSQDEMVADQPNDEEQVQETEQPESEQAQEQNETEISSTEQTTATNTTLDSSVELLYESAFAKTVINKSLDCGGLIPDPKTMKKTVYAGKSSEFIVIESQDISGFNQENLSLFNQMMANGGNQNLNPIRSGLFEQPACSGFGTEIITELDTTGYPYPNVDGYRAYLVSEGQDANLTPNLLLFAKRGDSIINISYNFNEALLDTPTYEEYSQTLCPNINNCKSLSEILGNQTNIQQAYVALNKITEDYQIKGTTTREEQREVVEVVDGEQTLTLTLEGLYDGPGLAASFFTDSSERRYVMKNNSALNESVKQVINSGADSERVSKAQFVITATVNESNEIIDRGWDSAQVDYELTRLQRYTFEY